MAATATLAYFNLAGYYIGAYLQGVSTHVYQALDVLCLQVTAKLLELLIVGSLGTILADIIRSHLLFGPEGLPFGLLLSLQRFKDIDYLISPELRFGLGGFSKRLKRVWVGLFILTISLISILAGPATALLMIPTQRAFWSAGGASYWLVGNDDILWPSHFTNATIGGSDCESPSMELLSSDHLNISGCIWGGYQSIVESLTDAHFNGEVNMVLKDGILKRDFYIFLTNAQTTLWTFASHLTVGIFSQNVGNAWLQTIHSLPSSSWLYPLTYRIQNQTWGYAESWVPAVRTSCNLYDPSSSEVGDSAKYPYFPEYGSPFGNNYMFPTNLSYSSQVLANWVPAPETAQLDDGSNTTYVSSAFINIQIPGDPSISNGTVAFTCTADVWWARGLQTGGAVGDENSDYIDTATILTAATSGVDLESFMYRVLPVSGDSWRQVRIDPDWLATLTPPISENSPPGENAMAALISSSGLDNSTGMVGDWTGVVYMFETAVGVYMADAMSRMGFTENVGHPSNWSEPTMPNWDNAPSSQASMLGGTYEFPPPPGGGPATKINWSVTVSGYAYSADSAAYYLALTVLFVHALLALAHIVYLLRSCIIRSAWICEAWDSYLGLYTLAIVSAGSRTAAAGVHRMFHNAGVGIDHCRTYKTRAYIRVVSAADAADQTVASSTAAAQGGGTGNDVALLFGDDSLRARLPKLKVNEAYG